MKLVIVGTFLLLAVASAQNAGGEEAAAAPAPQEAAPAQESAPKAGADSQALSENQRQEILKILAQKEAAPAAAPASAGAPAPAGPVTTTAAPATAGGKGKFRRVLNKTASANLDASKSLREETKKVNKSAHNHLFESVEWNVDN